MSAQLPPDGPAPPAGWLPANSHVGHQLSLVDLPEHIISKILDQLRPTGSVTSFHSTSKRPDVSREFFQSRASLASVVSVSRLFFKLGIPHLYHTVLLSNQTEVLQFFSEIARHPYRRSMVRSLAWVTVLSTDETNRQSTMLRQRQADFIAPSYWNFIDYWPHLPIDFQVAKTMGIVNSSTLETWRLLGAILALCPKIASLFLFHAYGNASAPPEESWPNSPEQNALAPLLWNGLPDDLSRGPSGLGFLAELQHLTVEPHENQASYDCAHFIIMAFLTNSPLLRRIELKCGLLLRAIWHDFSMIQNGRLLTENVKELVLLRAGDARDEMLALVQLFPKLVSLHAEYDDASYRPVPHLPLNFTISSALLKLSGTLETLSLTTSPASWGHWLYIEDYPPSLTSLHHMDKLKDLTTECMWLFGREDINIALKLSHLLPPTLVRFRLIDYWGTTHDTPPEYLPDSLKYHPVFPNQWSTAEFYYNILMTLVREDSPSLANLREVTLVSKHLCEELRARNNQGDQGQAYLTGSTEEPLLKLRASLGSFGIHFNLKMPGESEAAARVDWARIG